MDNYEEHYRISELIVKYLKGTISKSEYELLQEWREAGSGNEELFQKLAAVPLDGMDLSSSAQNEKRERAFHHILEHAVKAKQKKSLTFIVKGYVRYAAVLVLLLGVGYFFSKNYRQNSRPDQESPAAFLPGGTRAVLVLDSGKEIDLDDVGTGEIARQDRVIVSKTEDGSIAYNLVDGGNKNETSGKVKYNTVVTPRGGNYRLRLPDGTKVWLNAASSLTFPAGFSSKERSVELTGEAFFDVVKIDGGTVPFKVSSGNQVIEVLGTEFNVNGYADEKEITTTLVSGAVKVGVKNKHNASSGKDSNIMLKPGQKALFGRYETEIQVYEADLEELTAWKDGRFQFHDTPLEIIMRQIERWYDVDVVYEGNVKEVRFRGGISREVPAEQVFKILTASGINIKTEGRKIIVSQ